MIRVLAVPMFAAVDAAAIAAFAVDKRRTIAGQWRIAEIDTAPLTSAGGRPGARRARNRFGYKTRKQPFARQLDVIGMLHAELGVDLAAAFLI